MKTSFKKIARRLLIPAVLSMICQTASAAEYFLRADTFQKTMPDGAVVTMWGFALDDDGNFATEEHAATTPGPVLTVPPGDSMLTIHLYNRLPQLNGADVPVSIVIPGQMATLSPVRNPDGRVRSFTHETARLATGIYEWTGLKPGTYLYQSGSHPALEVQMGLYGAVRKDAAAGEVYPGISYQQQVVLLYSEIDPAFHQAVATNNYGPGKAVTSPNLYNPRYFLINGEPNPALKPVALLPGNPGDRLLVRFLNAGLQAHVPVMLGQYMSLIAEDGNALPYPREQYSVLLPAGKTMDAMIPTLASGARIPIFDRGLQLTTATASAATLTTYLAADTDADGVPDYQDNCTLVKNANQRDTNNDGYGNICDADFNGNNKVDVADLNALKAAYNTAVGNPRYNPDIDLNGDTKINVIDLNILKSYYLKAPGPSCCGQ